MGHAADTLARGRPDAPFDIKNVLNAKLHQAKTTCFDRETTFMMALSALPL